VRADFRDKTMKKMANETYQRQIVRLVKAMSRAEDEAAVANDLAAGSDAACVKMFVDGNLEKRRDKLEHQLEFVAEAFEEFDELIREYIRSGSSLAYDTAESDGERMLLWLTETKSLSPEQLDYITCQRARHAVEDLARKSRLKHVRFQELCSLTDRWLLEFDSSADLQVYLNPIRVWSRFETLALLDEDSTPPANVLFYAAGEEVGTAVLELEGQALINELADYQPCTLAEWVTLTSQAEPAELIETCRDLAEMGLVAFG